MAAIHRPGAHPWLAGLLRRLQAIEPRIQPGITAVYEGGAEGWDRDGREAAKALGIPWVVFSISPEEWTQHGKAAGPMRNRDMLRGFTKFAPIEPAEAVLAGPGGDGTADMIRQARKAGLPVLDLADPLVTAALASYQRWTKADAELVRCSRAGVLEAQRTRPGIGPPIVSGHWMKVEGVVSLSPWCLYVGRDAHGLKAHPRLHNPFPVRPLSADRYRVILPAGPVEVDGPAALDYFRQHLASKLPGIADELAAIVEQRRVLVCWCGESKPCHACVIAEVAVDVVAARAFMAACGAKKMGPVETIPTGPAAFPLNGSSP